MSDSDKDNIKRIRPVAYIHNDYREKFGIPRQAGINGLAVSRITFTEEYSDPSALEGLELFSHIWLIFGFSENDDNEKLRVKPPRLGGNERIGVFATRSPFRPNGLGLSSVKIKSILIEDGAPVIEVYGADLMDGTPIYDIKPYLPLFDIREDAVNNLEEKMNDLTLDVNVPEELLDILPEEKRAPLKELLTNDPRPQYKRNKDERYAFRYGGFDVRFSVKGRELTVEEIVMADDTMKLIK